MDIGKPLIDYGKIDAGELRSQMLSLPESFWHIDLDSRTTVAGDRPGNAVFFYTPLPPSVRRFVLAEARSGLVSVLRYPERPLFEAVRTLIDTHVQPLFPNCDVLWVQLAELPPGGVITPHCDRNILAQVHRLHIPLVTHDKVEFTIGGDVFHLKPDTLYDLNNAVMHSVTNTSDVMRIHLLVDMLPHRLARVRYFDDEAEMAAVASVYG